jgi:hypothetical protein
MWILDWLPGYVIHGMIVLGALGMLASLLLGAVPLMSQMRLPIQLVSVLLLVAGVWVQGGISERAGWEAKVQAARIEAARLATESAQANTLVVEKIVEKKVYITKQSAAVIQYVDREVTKYDAACVIPAPVVRAVNAAALNISVEQLNLSATGAIK